MSSRKKTTKKTESTVKGDGFTAPGASDFAPFDGGSIDGDLQVDDARNEILSSVRAPEGTG